jgi:hypothetical protein
MAATDTLEVGDMFVVDGYEIVATMQAVEGPEQVIVVHNNSSHVLIGVRRLDDDELPVCAQLLASLRYADNFDDVYKTALTVAAAEAVRR